MLGNVNDLIKNNSKLLNYWTLKAKSDGNRRLNYDDYE